MNRALIRYASILDELLWRRAMHGTLSEEIEEQFAVALNDCRSEMTAEDETRIPELVAYRKTIAAKESLGLVDTEPSMDREGRLRTEAA